MRLSLRILENCSSVNSYRYAQQAEFTEGDAPVDVYFQLVDSTLDLPEQGFSPAGRRYVPADGSTLLVTLDAVDSARKITRPGTQAFPGDPSIWKIQVQAADGLRGTIHMKVQLTEGTKVTYGYLSAALNISSMDGMTRV